MAKKDDKLKNQVAAPNVIIMDKDLPAYLEKMKVEGRALAFINNDGSTTPID